MRDSQMWPLFSLFLSTSCGVSKPKYRAFLKYENGVLGHNQAHILLALIETISKGGGIIQFSILSGPHISPKTETTR